MVKIWICKTCGDVFAWQVQYELHKKDRHGEEK